MHGRIKKSTVMALGAAVAAVGVASHASAQSAPDGTVTYVMSINDDGFGDYVPGSFAIYAIDGTVSGLTVTPNQIAANGNQVDGGIDNYDLHVTGGIVANTLNDVPVNGSASAANPGASTVSSSNYYELWNPTSHSKTSFVEAGFTYGTLNNDDSNTQVGAGQDTVGTPPSLAHVNAKTNATLIIFGLGQSAGDMKNFATSTTGNNPGIPAGTAVATGLAAASSPYAGPGTFTYGAQTYLNGLLIADGQFTGTAPSINLASSTTGLLEAYGEAYDTTAKGYDGAGASTVLALITQTLGGAPVPEPASVGMLGIGAMGLLARRRRRGLEAK
jgi:hypothetical protein